MSQLLTVAVRVIRFSQTLCCTHWSRWIKAFLQRRTFSIDSFSLRLLGDPIKFLNTALFVTPVTSTETLYSTA